MKNLIQILFTNLTFQTTEGDPGSAECSPGPEEAEGRSLEFVQQVRCGGGSHHGAGHGTEREDRDRQAERLPGENRTLTEKPAESS